MNYVIYSHDVRNIMLTKIPDVCIDDLSSNIDADLPRNAGDLPLCFFGQQLKAQTTPALFTMTNKNKSLTFEVHDKRKE